MLSRTLARGGSSALQEGFSPCGLQEYFKPMKTRIGHHHEPFAAVVVAALCCWTLFAFSSNSLFPSSNRISSAFNSFSLGEDPLDVSSTSFLISSALWTHAASTSASRLRTASMISSPKCVAPLRVEQWPSMSCREDCWSCDANCWRDEISWSFWLRSAIKRRSFWRSVRSRILLLLRGAMYLDDRELRGKKD